MKSLPSTLSIQYYFYDPNGRIRAYAGAGLNYTAFFNERTSGALAGSQLYGEHLGTIELDPYAVGLFIGRHLR